VKIVTGFWVAGYGVTGLKVTGYGLGATNWEKSKISNQKIKNYFWGCEPKTIVEH
jgi:hypothetical protein